MDLIAHIREWIADTLWPPRCAVCGRTGMYACTTCLAAVAPLARQHCPGCGRPSIIGLPCFACRGRTHLDRLIAAASLGPSSEAFIHAFKYRNISRLAVPLARLMCDLVVGMPAASGLLATNPVVVPVPLHPRRLRERGYNQAALLAERFASITALAMRTDALTRTRPTHQQVKTSSRSERRENMTGAFVAADVTGQDILLIDDVTTTGATLEDCARALKDAGAHAVSALTLAHG